MAFILSLETSTTLCSVALHRQGELLSLRELDEAGAHSARLMELVQACLAEGGVGLKEVDAIAVSSGPGSYTGLRIGVSSAKGLALALQRPIIGVGAMRVLAQAVKSEVVPTVRIIPMLDARRMEVYAQVFDENLKEMGAVTSVVLNEHSFQNHLERYPVRFVGDGVPKAKELIHHPNAHFSQISISAKFMGEVAWEKFLNREFEDLIYFAPDYLKEFKVLKSKKNLLLK